MIKIKGEKSIPPRSGKNPRILERKGSVIATKTLYIGLLVWGENQDINDRIITIYT